ncbi:MAG TPA: glycosyltransferase family 1 protein [Burkholderiales bacterium]|nr:glycosyltransferase family 1 protein [Burkholderiales bacterium]
MRVLLIGNYPADRQESMRRFCQVLEQGLTERGFEVRVVQPGVVFSRAVPESSFLRKWLGYVDKFLLFPWRLRRSLAWADLVHVCDHSNAVYAGTIGAKPALVTCHDLLAIRSALGDFPENATGWSGRLYQRWISHGLRKSAFIACVSEATRGDVLRLIGKDPRRVFVVHNGLNYPYTAMPRDEARRVIGAHGFADTEFLLHVGGNQWYKNRLGVLRIFSELVKLSPTSHLRLVLAGKPCTMEMRRYMDEHGLTGRVIELRDVGNEELRALYSTARGLLFPSLYEGFGWPVIEAHACGCPVFTSARPPLTEIGGGCAVYFDPDDAAGAARRIAQAISGGEGAGVSALANASRFSKQRMIDGYVRIYATLAGA